MSVSVVELAFRSSLWRLLIPRSQVLAILLSGVEIGSVGSEPLAPCFCGTSKYVSWSLQGIGNKRRPQGSSYVQSRSLASPPPSPGVGIEVSDAGYCWSPILPRWSATGKPPP